MLYNDNARNIPLKSFHHLKDGFRSSRGSADRNDAVPSAGNSYVTRNRCAVYPLQLANLCCGGNLYFSRQFLGQKVIQLLPCQIGRLIDKIHSSGLKRIKHFVVQRTDHNDRKRILGHQPP